jgi:precorrin-6B methylase 1
MRAHFVMSKIQVAFSRLYTALNRPKILMEIGCVAMISNTSEPQDNINVIESDRGLVVTSNHPFCLQQIVSLITSRSTLIQRLGIQCEVLTDRHVYKLNVLFSQ